MQLIATTSELERTCAALAREPFVTVDTEFVRETTFWPELCLIQLAGDGIEAIVDPLAPGIDLGPFFGLMADERVLKVFHAARQDIEIVHHLSGIIPHPLFDTQIAAMVCGFGESVSYQNLAKRLAGQDIDKSSQFTDWRARPLSDKQLVYALSDVTHLRTIYASLAADLEASGRADWLEQEMDVLTAPATYNVAPQDAWRRLKMRVKSRKSLAILVEVAAWREAQAQQLNVPRQRVLKDDAIYDIANQAPRDRQALAKLRTIHDGIARSDRAEAIVGAVTRGLARDPSSLPRLERPRQLSAGALAAVELLKVLLKGIAADSGVAPKLIASSEELEQIAAGEIEDVPALKGWRRQLFGNAALAVCRGEKALALRDGSVELIDIS